MVGEKQCQEFNANQEKTTSTKDTLMTEIDSTDTNLGQQGQKVRVSERFHAPSEILGNVDTMRKASQQVSHIYRNWRPLSREEKNATALPIEQTWTKELNSKEPNMFEPTTTHSTKATKDLRNLKGIQEEFKRAQTGRSILSRHEQDETSRQQVDQREVARHSLLDISDIGVKMIKPGLFRKRNLRDAYHSIRLTAEEADLATFYKKYEDSTQLVTEKLEQQLLKYWSIPTKQNYVRLTKEERGIEAYLRKHEYHTSLAGSTLLEGTKFTFENPTYLGKVIGQVSDTRTASKKKLYHNKDRIDTIIQNYHDRSLQGHSDIFETLQLLRQECNFPSTRSEVEAYFKRCLSYQHDKGEEEQSP